VVVVVELVKRAYDRGWLAEGAAVATALGGGGRRRRRRRLRVLTGAIGMLDLEERRTGTGRGRLGKVGWQVGSRVARPACCCSGSTGAAGAVARAGCLAGLATCIVHAYSVSALGNGATLTTGSLSSL